MHCSGKLLSTFRFPESFKPTLLQQATLVLQLLSSLLYHFFFPYSFPFFIPSFYPLHVCLVSSVACFPVPVLLTTFLSFAFPSNVLPRLHACPSSNGHAFSLPTPSTCLPASTSFAFIFNFPPISVFSLSPSIYLPFSALVFLILLIFLPALHLPFIPTIISLCFYHPIPSYSMFHPPLHHHNLPHLPCNVSLSLTPFLSPTPFFSPHSHFPSLPDSPWQPTGHHRTSHHFFSFRLYNPELDEVITCLPGNRCQNGRAGK